jgi:hypothetical protein
MMERTRRPAPYLYAHVEERIARECPRCHRRWPSDWDMCPNCAVSLLGTDRRERIVHLVPSGPSHWTVQSGGRVAESGAAGTDGRAPVAGQMRPPAVFLACRLRCSSEVVVEEDLRAGGEMFRQALSIVDVHGGCSGIAAGIGVMGVWKTESHGADPALRAATAIAGLLRTRSDVSRRRSDEDRVNTGVSVTSVTATTPPGEAERLAVRLADLAAARTVLVSQNIYEGTADRFDYQGVSPAVPRSDPLPALVFRLLGPKPERSGTHYTGPERFPLVGRRGVLQMLDACLGEAASGRGMVLHLIGEPGAGKSRLVRAWLAAAPPGTCLRLSSHGVPYGGYAWRAWRRLVRPLWAGDAGGEREHPPTGPTVSEVLARLRAIRRPVVIVVDDLHWVDVPSREAIAGLAARLANIPALAILAYRPSFVRHAPREPRDSTRHLRLREMGDLGMRALVDGLAARTDVDVPAALRRQIVRRSHGNPLYAEEAVAYLADVRSDNNSAPPGLPASLPELLIRRIRLAAKRTLPDLQQRSRHLTVFAPFAPGSERDAVLDRLDALEERLAGWLDRFDVIEEEHGLVEEFLRRLRHLDGELALLSLLLGRQRPHRQRLAQALDRLGALPSEPPCRG